MPNTKLFEEPLPVRTSVPFPVRSDAKLANATVKQLPSDGVEAYNYHPLEPNEIRVLELLPNRDAGSEDGHLLRGRILTVNIEKPPEYSALSYTWGKPSLDHEVIVLEGGGKREKQYKLKITAQLHKALLLLQDAHKSRLYWVDQVSINQQNIQERKYQVMLMKMIYESAATTIIWLGECKDKRDISPLEELSQELQQTTLSPEQITEQLPETKKKYPYAKEGEVDWDLLVQNRYDADTLKHLIDTKTKDGSTPGARRRIAVANLFNQPWFNRSWTCQEAVVSPNIRVLYGTMEMSYETLSRVGYLVQRVLTNDLGWRYALHNTTTGYGAFQSTKLFKSNLRRKGEACKNFLDLLWRIQHDFKSTDPRDMVYAFLGLRPDSSYPDMVADYSVSDAGAYAETARCMIELTGSLVVLGAVEGNTVWNCECSLVIPNLPSWAPNWSQKFHGVRPISWVDMPNHFSAARGKLHTMSESSDPLVLVAKGALVGRVDKIFPQRFDGGYSYFDGLPKLLQLDAILQNIRADHSTPAPEVDAASKLSHVVLRTLLADGSFSDFQPLKFPIEDLMHTCMSDAGGVRPEDALKDPVLDYAQSTSLILQRKRFIQSSTVHGQRLGLTNLYARTGDLICILYGSPAPVLLRKVVEDVDTAEPRYRVICQCYLDGWMFGKAANEAWWKEFEENPQTYRLV